MKRGVSLSMELVVSLILLLCVGILLILFFQGRIYETVKMVEFGGSFSAEEGAGRIISGYS
ncbi:MAG: hypothetical protein ABH829_04075 [archaeon]